MNNDTLNVSEIHYDDERIRFCYKGFNFCINEYVSKKNYSLEYNLFCKDYGLMYESYFSQLKNFKEDFRILYRSLMKKKEDKTEIEKILYCY
jgi:hypothetical protein